MNYIDGYVTPVPTANREIYGSRRSGTAVVFKDHGALSVVECWGDDVPEGKLTSFPMAVQRKPDETVVFSWIVWPSRQVRDEGHEEGDGRPAYEARPRTRCPSMAKRLIFGGFELLVDA